METRQLRLFLVLAEELHFGRAALRLRVAQSAVSQTIKGLEEQLGAKLFDRTKRRVALTEAGRSLAVHAQAALREIELGAIAVRRAAAGDSGRLALRFTTMCALTLLPRAVASFRRAHPGVEISIESGGSTEQLEALARGACDLAFVPRATDVAPLASEPVEESPLVALLPSRHPLARKRSITFASFDGARVMLLTERNEPRMRSGLRRKLAALGVEPEIVLEVDQLETILAFVAASYGISVAPAFVARMKFPGVAYVPITPKITAGVRVVWDPSALSVTASRFLDVLREERARSALKEARRAD